MRYALVLLFLVSPAMAQDIPEGKDPKSPIPAEAELAGPRNDIDEVFADQIKAARTTTAKSKLANEILDLAIGTEDPFEKYALIEQAQELATDAKDLTLTFQVIDLLAETFQVDKEELRKTVKQELAGGSVKTAKVLQQLEELDAIAEANPAKISDVADACYKLANTLRGPLQQAAKERAIKYYETVVSKLSGLKKRKAEKRIDELRNDVGNVSNRYGQGRIIKIDYTKGLSAKEAAKVQRDAARAFGVPVEIKNHIDMVFRFIPAGTFRNGAPEETIEISRPFYIGITEVTQEQYWHVTKQKPSHAKNAPRNPVENVSLTDTENFCEKLSALDKEKKYTLPNETQWQCACSAGSIAAFSFGNDLGQLGNYAWYRKNTWDKGRRSACEVAKKLPNAWRLYDMYGNVWEICKKSIPAKADSCVLRGGSFDNDGVAGGNWTLTRLPKSASSKRFNVGFRVVMSL